MSPTQHCHVLVVEDHPDLQHAWERTLERLEVAGDVVGTCADAIARLDGQSAMVLDLQLPDGCGLEVLHAARRDHPQTKIAIFSGTADMALLVDAAAAGPDRLFRKPDDFSALIAWVRQQA